MLEWVPLAFDLITVLLLVKLLYEVQEAGRAAATRAAARVVASRQRPPRVEIHTETVAIEAARVEMDAARAESDAVRVETDAVRAETDAARAETTAVREQTDRR